MVSPPYDFHNSFVANRYLERKFLCLLLCSLVLHLLAWVGVQYLHLEAPPQPEQKPIMVDLQDVPDLPAPPTAEAGPPAHRQAEKKTRVQRQTAPKGLRESDMRATLPVPARRPPLPAAPAAPQQQQPSAQSTPLPRMGDLPAPKQEPALRPPAAGELFKPGARQVQRPASQLFPTAKNLAKIEETYRKKYSDDVEDGDTRFLDTDDFLFTGFLRRFETAVYGVWRYPSEAVKLGIEGVTPVRITFNRRGEIQEIKLLESSGSRLLDEEVLRTLRSVGVVGSLPKGYTKDEFHLIAFFQYGIVRSPTRSLR